MLYMLVTAGWIKTGVLGQGPGRMAEIKKEETGVEELKRKGWETAIAFFDGMGIEEIKRALGEACSHWGLEEFEDLRREAKKQRRALDMADNKVRSDPASTYQDNTWVPQTGHADLRGRPVGVDIQVARKALPRMIWPTRLQRKLSHAKEDDQRERIEEDERMRQIGKLVDLLSKAGLLKEDSRQEGAASVWMTKRRAMGRRASTLRVHVRTGEKMRLFSASCLDKPWFGNVADVMDYIAGRLEEPCGKSIPVSIMGALKFLESAAEVPQEARLSEHPVLLNFMAEISRSKWWTGREKVSANRLVAAVVLCWEFVVMEETERSYVRVYAWYKLIKLWAMLRWNDTLGVPPMRMQMGRYGDLSGEIVRSKTTGAGKKIDVQFFYVSKDAWLMAEGWLKKGYEIFQQFGREAKNEKRDFMLPRPSSGLDGFRSSMVTYPDAMAMSRALLRELKAPIRSGGQMEDLVVTDEVGGFWSEHSERVTMASWAAATKIRQDIIKRWGRWRPSVDEEYVKTTKMLVLEAQGQVANTIKRIGWAKDPVGDEEVFQQLAERLEERAVDETLVRKQLRRLRFPQKNQQESMLGAVDVARRGPIEEKKDEEPEEEDPKEWDMEEFEAGIIDPVSEVPTGTYVMSLVGRSRKRTLHQVGACYRKPGLDYRDFVVIGENRPELVAGERLCGSCFGARDKAASECEEEEVSSISSSSDLLSSDPDQTDSD